MSLLDKHIALPFKAKSVTIKHILVHTAYWILIAAFFSYEKRYLIYKASMPYFMLCVVGRIAMLAGVAYLNIHYFLPGFLHKGDYLRYSLLMLLSVLGYLLMQGLFDFLLYGFLLGPMRNSNLLETISYNFFSTIWYLAIMVAVKLSIDWFELQGKRGEQARQDAAPFTFVKSGTRKIKLYFNEVTHIEGLKDYAIVHTTGEKIIIKGSVKYMSELFPEAQFIRVHKSFIVSREKITQIEKNKIRIGEHQIPIGRSYKAALDSYTT